MSCNKSGDIAEAVEAMTGMPAHQVDMNILTIYTFSRERINNPKAFYEGFSPVDF